MEQEFEEREVKKQIKIDCHICGEDHIANLEAVDCEEMEMLIQDVEDHFICQSCFNKPSNRKTIMNILDIPEELGI